jgi:hypothetical protein
MPSTWPFGPDAAGQFDRRVAEAAADIHHPVIRLHLEAGKHTGAVMGQPVDQDVLPAHEFRHQDLVPEVDIFVGLNLLSGL